MSKIKEGTTTGRMRGMANPGKRKKGWGTKIRTAERKGEEKSARGRHGYLLNIYLSSMGKDTLPVGTNFIGEGFPHPPMKCGTVKRRKRKKEERQKGNCR
jgi:hypothetical protein